MKNWLIFVAIDDDTEVYLSHPRDGDGEVGVGIRSTNEPVFDASHILLEGSRENMLRLIREMQAAISQKEDEP